MELLVIVDMQRDFIDGALGTKEAVAILSYVENAIKSHKGKVLFTFIIAQTSLSHYPQPR